jgi:hypothetical protein
MNLLPSVYFGNIFYWNIISKEEKTYVDEGEFFIKQTYRNRAEICTEKGTTPLIIPLEKGKNSKQAMCDVRISYDENWRTLHFKTICSAYGKAAYFDHYKPEIEQLFFQKPIFLCEWNHLWFDFFSEEFNLSTEHISYTKTYIENQNNDQDFRDVMHPKPLLDFSHKPYYNVFFDKFPQPQNLSVMDLLMNEGPHGTKIISGS